MVYLTLQSSFIILMALMLKGSSLETWIGIIIHDDNTEYNKEILSHYVNLAAVSLRPLTEWLSKHIAHRWSISGKSADVSGTERIFLSNHIVNLSGLIKNWDESSR
ncbi:MAG: hypothetical protein KZQ63_02395 [Candidatus Thiodiazotropha sp. (ex Lucinoma aequizonata)]|nr:hypothetical protein [Candidatus Thiodiazotropha sp. (ex Lucinoma aequizonata)]MCU7908953.1 hypothetical protein [Candidatus Thiodiazotropha sp. (ex Lucinoma aequizonata)]MCU7911064.1 hypothetical protein [Candidatus Thiodiazotropha sp. (ex Lucinoma aequizonata)]